MHKWKFWADQIQTGRIGEYYFVYYDYQYSFDFYSQCSIKG